MAEALEIVHELADQNAIDKSRDYWRAERIGGEKPLDEDLAREADKQRLALNTVEDFITNHSDELDGKRRTFVVESLGGEVARIETESAGEAAIAALRCLGCEIVEKEEVGENEENEEG